MDRIKRVLLIDDDDIYVAVASFKLTQFFDEVSISIAQNVTEIEQRMNEKYDLILLDLNMPDTTGWQVLERYGSKLAQNLPVVVICSSSVDPADIRKADEMSDKIAGFISKPIEFEDLERHVSSWRARS